MSSLDYLDLCRLCLVKDRVSVPIFEGEGDVRQIFLKIAACLPVKVAREDKLPKKICDDCVYKVELFYQFWNTTVNAEKQLLQWLGEVGMDGKQGYVTNTLNQNVMKQEQSTENRLDGSVMQQVSEHQNNMNMGMMDNMGLGIPMMISSANQQQITSVPMDTSGSSVQTVQAVPGPSSQTTHNQISQNQTNSTTQQEEEEESSEDEENSDDECDGDEGLPVKEESEEDPNSRTIEPTTFVNVSLACDEAGPSGLQQQKISDMSEIPMQQPADADPKSGMSPTTEIPTIKMPVQPLFVACRGVPILDQEEKEQSSTESRSPISDDEDQDLQDNVEGHGNWKLLEQDEDDELFSDNNDDMYLSETNYCRLPDIVKKESLRNEVHNNSLSSAVCEDSSIEIDLPRHEVQTVLVPVRDPVTNEIKNELVPVEMKDETGVNIIKSVLIPIRGEDGLLSYEIKKVVVPIKPLLNLPLRQYSPIICNSPQMISVSPTTSESNSEQKRRRLNRNAGNSVDNKKIRGSKGDTNQKVENNKSEKTGEKKEEKGTESNVCPYCQKIVNDHKKLDQHIRRNHTKPYRCTKCSNTYVSKEAYEEHVKSHEKPSFVECPFCRQRYRRMAGLRQHQIRVHSTIEAKFECDYCGKRFRLKGDLMMHIERTHLYVTKVCRFCGKNVKNIAGHEWQHKKAGKKLLYQCHLCPNKFRKQNGLENHLLMHKSGFKCDKCRAVFTCQAALTKHKNARHKADLVCTICEKEFLYRGNFYQHVISHAGVRPYKCDVCGEDFSHKITFIKHRNSHPGPLPPLNMAQIADLAKQILENR
ncbi:uncharacterized protein LOC143182094 isoform X2 [Calliopsis andreniformis]|uniref:uncharacterized protein LOC143182094 isoform X2 n=1 Tax=Calliopsis andreniformis TaxID=337506 RepID=UPI003FCCC7E0